MKKLLKSVEHAIEKSMTLSLLLKIRPALVPYAKQLPEYAKTDEGKLRALRTIVRDELTWRQELVMKTAPHFYSGDIKECVELAEMLIDEVYGDVERKD